jgi:hypothetical protein
MAITNKKITIRKNHPRLEVIKASAALVAVSKPFGVMIPHTTRAPITMEITINII